MIRFKRDLFTSEGFMKKGTVTSVFTPHVEDGFVGIGWAEWVGNDDNKSNKQKKHDTIQKKP